MLRIKSSFVALIVMFCLCCTGVAVCSAEDEIAKEFIDKPVPAISLKDIDGNVTDIASYKGKAVLINFWGLRCGSCIDEMPHLNKLYDDYKDKGLVILGVNADGIDGEFLKGPRGMTNLPLELKYTIIEDIEMTLIDTFKMEAAPLNILIDKEGIVKFYHMGYEPGDEKKLEAAVKASL